VCVYRSAAETLDRRSGRTRRRLRREGQREDLLRTTRRGSRVISGVSGGSASEYVRSSVGSGVPLIKRHPRAAKWRSLLKGSDYRDQERRQTKIKGWSRHAGKPNQERSDLGSPRLDADGHPDLVWGLGREIMESESGEETDYTVRNSVRCFNQREVFSKLMGLPKASVQGEASSSKLVEGSQAPAEFGLDLEDKRLASSQELLIIGR
jgi:hypothetical protein